MVGSLILTSHFQVVEKFKSDLFYKFYYLFTLDFFLLKHNFDVNYESNDSQ